MKNRDVIMWKNQNDTSGGERENKQSKIKSSKLAIILLFLMALANSQSFVCISFQLIFKFTPLKTLYLFIVILLLPFFY